MTRLLLPPRAASLALLALLVLYVAASTTACAPMLPTAPAAPPPAPAATPTAGAAPVASPLSYGAVTSQVVKGRTTQLELLQTFGGPNISTVDRDGVETWVYERTATQTEQQSQAQSAQATASLGAFFKYVDVGVGGGVARSSGGVTTSGSVRSLTVIVKFAADKTVADYSVRATTF
ncbi:hypothetical protein [Piscinibacter sp.]|uniref:hypothetical protein n=1 Tax=Piscinibacter sp. TaxID=1903157 RepID=UPI0039E69DAD